MGCEIISSIKGSFINDVQQEEGRESPHELLDTAYNFLDGNFMPDREGVLFFEWRHFRTTQKPIQIN